LAILGRVIDPEAPGSKVPMPHRTPLEVGALLRGKWRLERQLGEGAMASVYAATHRNGLRGAVKVLHPEYAADSAVRRRFLREGYVANRVGHPGAVAVLDDDETDDGTAFLVMELLDGHTLTNVLAGQPGRRMPPQEVALIADRVLDVLIHAHEKGIVHRDLKPDNLFVTHDGQIKVLDFGIARLLDRTDSSLATQAGFLLGTPAYMAPEQARGHVDRVDARSDVWAVGAVMFALLTGREVHAGAKTVQELLVAAMTQPAPRIATCMEIEAPLAHVVDRALAFEADARWKTARAMQVALRDAHLALFGTALPTSSARKQSAPPAASPNRQETVETPKTRGLPRWTWGAFPALAIVVGTLSLRLCNDEPRSAAPAATSATPSAIQPPPEPVAQAQSLPVPPALAPDAATLLPEAEAPSLTRPKPAKRASSPPAGAKAAFAPPVLER
jgi:serine/threonine protein kinase